MTAGLELDAGAEWIATTLGQDGTLLGYLASPAAGFDAPIYQEVAPEGAPLPAVVFGLQSAQDVMVVGADRIFTNALWLVRVLAQTEDYQEIALAAARLDALLHRQSGTTPDGTTWGCLRERPHRLAETVNGDEYRNAGGIYRLFISG